VPHVSRPLRDVGVVGRVARAFDLAGISNTVGAPRELRLRRGRATSLELFPRNALFLLGVDRLIVRRRLIQIGALLILAVCVAGHVSEVFDDWDHTVQTGNDIDYGTVVVALITGAVLGVAHLVALLIPAVSVTFRPLSSFTKLLPISFNPDFTGYSPPPPLRI
jgi:hypothetical protein